jgi:hypothetical protein
MARSAKYQQWVHDRFQAGQVGGTGYRVELRGPKWVVISRRTNARIISFQRKGEAERWIKSKQGHL